MRAIQVIFQSLLVIFLLLVASCSRAVSSDKVYGSYKASYPFGTAVLSLGRDGTFTQKVTINGEGSQTTKGSWTFDSERSKLNLHGAMPIVDGFGHLEKNWRATDELSEQPVERVWFKTVIEISNQYPYVKQ